MSVIEQIQELSIDINDESNYKALIEALGVYREMLKSGQLKPRESQAQSMYIPFEFRSNCT